MPVVEKTDVIGALERLRDQLNHADWSAADAVVQPAIDEIRRLRNATGMLRSELAEQNPTRHLGD